MDEKEKCLEYVPCLVFDLDACASTYQRFLLQTKLQELDYVFAAFPSPSGYGLRVLVWTAATYETHRNVYQKIVEELCKFLGVTANKADGVHFDASCKNESRHFYYVAVEKNKFYLNLESKIFEYHSISEPLPVNKPTIILQEKTIEKENIDNYTYIDALTEDVKVEFILKSINMNKPRKLQCFDFGCLCKENNVPFDLAKSVAMQHFYDSEQKNPEKVITTQLKDGYDQTNARYSDEQFIAFLRDTYHVKVVLAPRKNETIEKKETISTPQDKTEAEIERNYKKNLKKVKNESKNDFPIEAFPSKTAEIIKAFQNADGYPMDYCNNSSFFYTTKYLFIQECTTEWISFKKRGIPKKNYLCAKIIRLC
jgi:hypothetical protein